MADGRSHDYRQQDHRDPQRQKVHDQAVCDKATGSEIDNKVKEPGPIFLQGDHGTVSFRNMRIKELK